MRAKMPTAATGESGSTSMAVAAASPRTPSVTLRFPVTLPKAGSRRMTRPNRITPTGITSSPTSSRASNMPWFACHRSTSVACSAGVVPSAWYRSESREVTTCGIAPAASTARPKMISALPKSADAGRVLRRLWKSASASGTHSTSTAR
jgi:hypothetical protein